MSKGFASNYRIVLLGFGVLASFVGVGARLVDLHVIDRARLVSDVDEARRQITVVTARRGDILDTRGDTLATSRSVIVLGVDPQALRDEDKPKWPRLAQMLGMPAADLEKVFDAKTRAPAPGDKAGEDRLIRWAKLSDSVEESTYDEITRLGIKGVYGNRTYRRAYPHDSMAAHLIGYVNKQGQAAAGVESYADFYLRGQDGWRESEKDGLRRELAQFRSREVDATPGYTVVLSIDSVVQHIVEHVATDPVRRFQPRLPCPHIAVGDHRGPDGSDQRQPNTHTDPGRDAAAAPHQGQETQLRGPDQGQPRSATGPFRQFLDHVRALGRQRPEPTDGVGDTDQSGAQGVLAIIVAGRPSGPLQCQQDRRHRGTVELQPRRDRGDGTGLRLGGQ